MLPVLRSRLGWLVGALALQTALHATVALPSVFGDHAVLQRGKELPVWGTAAPGEKVEVLFGGRRAGTTADEKGNWHVVLLPLKASDTPAELTVRGTNTVTVKDLLVGDVWLCSGQSNMEKPIGERSGQKPVFNAEEELKTGNRPHIRLLKVAKNKAATPVQDIAAQWVVCTPESLEQTKFSAIGFFFGRKIQDEMKVPIGLIDSSWGGTRIEPWTSPDAFALFPSLRDFASAARHAGEKAEGSVPSELYYGMIQPLAPFALRGVLWYQGESNLNDVNDSEVYPDKMEALILGWRDAWRDPELPFFYVQIAPHLYHVVRRKVVISPESEAEFWEAQAAALRVPNTGMVVTTDLVDDLFDIHPRNKQDVALRLAGLALARTYKRSGVVDSGPVLKKWEVKDDRVKLFFNYAQGGLVSRDGKPLSWFTIAGADGKFFPADAQLAGEQVIVSSPEVDHPVTVRFAWDEAAQPNLANKAGLPARPFRTDNPFEKTTASN